MWFQYYAKHHKRCKSKLNYNYSVTKKASLGFLGLTQHAWAGLLEGVQLLDKIAQLRMGCRKSYGMIWKGQLEPLKVNYKESFSVSPWSLGAMKTMKSCQYFLGLCILLSLFSLRISEGQFIEIYVEKVNLVRFAVELLTLSLSQSLLYFIFFY